MAVPHIDCWQCGRHLDYLVCFSDDGIQGLVGPGQVRFGGDFQQQRFCKLLILMPSTGACVRFDCVD